jgi:hypothetical protein
MKTLFDLGQTINIKKITNDFIFGFITRELLSNKKCYTRGANE